MKNIKKVLSLVLVVCMLLSLMPVGVLAADYDTDVEIAVTDETTNETNPAEEAETEPEKDETLPEETAPEVTEPAKENMAGEASMEIVAEPMAVTMDTITKNQSVPLDTTKFYTIFHLDCGRNYFSVQQIKNIIDEMAKDGYNTLELAIGNDALRFLLDDMSVTANGKTYDGTTITNAVKSGNKSYRNNGTNELSQSEMDTIIDYANSKGISIIPLVNAPGHMNTILYVMNAVGISNAKYSNDPRTMDVTNAEAVNFSLALLKKYVDYFAGKGCKIFNMGADEYANTTYSSDSMGFGNLISTKKYNYYVDYVNNMAAQIQNVGMTAMAFNDGIYFNSNTSFGTFDSNIAIAYWSAGWGSYLLAPASFLANKGHKIINTNDAWYYVVGRETGNTYSYTTATNGVKNTKVTDIPGNNDPTAYGAMMCVWYDNSATYSESNVFTLLSTLAENNPTYFVANTTPEEPVITENTVTDNGVSVTALGLTELTAESATATVEGAKNVVAYNVTPKTASGNYTGEAVVVMPVPAGWTTKKVIAFVVNGDNTLTKPSVTINDGSATFTAPHFSVMGLAEMDEQTPELVEKTIDLTVGETKTDVQEGSFPGTYPTADTSIATATVTTGTGAGTPATEAKVTKVTSVSNGEYILGNGSQWVVLNADGTIGSTTDASQATKWTVTKSGSSYTFKSGDKYLAVGTTTIPGSYNSAGKVKYSTVARSDNSNYTSTNYYYLVDGQYYPVYYTRTTSGGFFGIGATTTYTLYYKNGNDYVQFANGTNGNTTVQLYTKGEDTTQTGLVAQDNSYNWSLSSSYGFYNGSNYIRYNNGWTLGSRSSSADAFTYTYTPGTDAIPGGPITTASFTGVSEGTTTVTIGNVHYTINVTDKAPPGALTNSNLTLEYWITNHTVHKTTSSSSASSATIPSSAASSSEGVAVTDYAPEQAYSFFDGTVTVYYWQSMRLDANNKQTSDANDDETSDGTTFTRVRYHGGAWQYMTKDGAWHYFLSTDQAVAYYMQKTSVTKEVDTMMKDWGWGLGNQDGEPHVMLSVGVVYPDGTLSPDEAGIYQNSSVLFNYWSGRDIGIVAPVSNADYEVEKITYTYGTRAGSTSSNKWSSTGSVNWNKKTTAAGSQWYDETVVWDDTMTTTPVVNGKTSNITWTAANTGILILIYLKPVHHDTNLTVQWVDDSTNTTITSQEIVVDYTGSTAPTFLTDIVNNGQKGAPAGDIDLKDDAYIVNKVGVNQTFNKDLTIMNNIPGQYTSGLYNYVGADISADGKTLTLHYTIDSSKLTHNYVVDFGLPVEVSLSDFGITNSANVSKVTTTSNASYADGKIKYEPSKVLTGIETVTARVEFKSGNPQTLNIGFIPATTVYYEEGFASFDNSWYGGSKGTQTQTTSEAKTETGTTPAVYGNDIFYAGNSGASNGTEAISNTKTSKATFTFTGTGVDVYLNRANNTGRATIQVIDGNGKTIKLAVVETATNGTYGGVALTKAYNTKVVSLKGLEHGNYTVKVIVANDEVRLDGFRVYGTMDMGNEVYVNDLEDNPTFFQMRDVVLTAVGVSAEDYYVNGFTPTYNQIIEELDGVTNGAVVLFDTMTGLNDATKEDILKNGPKNELYLGPNETLVFKTTTDRVVELGIKGVNGEASYTITGKSGTQTCGTVDMFYQISSGSCTITNTSENTVLSITELKVCDEPSGSVFGELTEADIAQALSAMFEEETADATLNISMVDYTGKQIASTQLTANGTVGEGHWFSAEEILNAAKAALPSGYDFAAPNTVENVSVTYGEDGTLKLQVGKVATLVITYKRIGRVIGTATLTKVQTSSSTKATFSTSDIIAAAPAGCVPISLAGTSVKFGGTGKLNVTCL